MLGIYLWLQVAGNLIGYMGKVARKGTEGLGHQIWVELFH